MQHLDLSFTRIGHKGVAELVKGKWPHLQLLSLHSCYLNHQALTHLSQAAWPELRELVLGGNQRLNNVVISGDAFKQDGGAKAIAELVRCHWPKLESLSLNKTCIAAKGLAVLKQGSWPNFKKLMLSGNHSSTILDLINAEWPSVSHLNLSSALYSLSIADLITGQWPLLEVLDVSSSCICEQELSLLSQAYWPRLKCLHIQENWSRENPDVVKVARMLSEANWPLLERLDVSGRPLNTVAAGLLVNCAWSKIAFLKFTRAAKEGAIAGMCRSAWPQLSNVHEKRRFSDDVNVTLSQDEVKERQPSTLYYDWDMHITCRDILYN